jgi:hypothetical protein
VKRFLGSKKRNSVRKLPIQWHASSDQNVKNATENKQQRMKGEDIAHRLLVFAVRLLRLVRKLHQDTVGRDSGRQLLRAATAGGSIASSSWTSWYFFASSPAPPLMIKSLQVG